MAIIWYTEKATYNSMIFDIVIGHLQQVEKGFPEGGAQVLTVMLVASLFISCKMNNKIDSNMYGRHEQ